MKEHDVFISYSRKDSDIVKLVVNRLRENGISVWIDEEGIETGDSFKGTITKAIEGSTCVIFFSSESSNRSKWTEKEIGLAMSENIPVIPVVLDDSKYNPEIKLDLINRDFVDMKDFSSFDRSVARIVKAIKKNQNAEDTDDAKVPETDGVNCGSGYFTDEPKQYFAEESKHIDNSNAPENHPDYAPQQNVKKWLIGFARRIFPYSPVVLLVFMIFCLGFDSLLLYPVFLIILYEIGRRKGCATPISYERSRKMILLIVGLLYIGPFIIAVCCTRKSRDTVKEENVVNIEASSPEPEAVEGNNGAVPASSFKAFSKLSNEAHDFDNAMIEEASVDEMTENSNESGISTGQIRMPGKIGDEDAVIDLKEINEYQIYVVLYRDSVKYSHCRASRYEDSFQVSVVDQYGDHVGYMKGYFTIEDDILKYMGKSYGNSFLKDKRFEFECNAPEKIPQLIKSLTTTYGRYDN